MGVLTGGGQIGTSELLAAGGIVPYHPAGQYYQAASGVAQSRPGSNGNVDYLSFWVAQTLTVDRIGVGVVTAGDVGSFVRLGIYADDGSGKPGALLLDAGTIDGGSATAQEITISKQLTAGLYWTASVCQNVVVTAPICRGLNGNQIVGAVDTLSNAVTFTQAGWSQAGVTGALPANATTIRLADIVRKVVLRVASIP